ncbi:hypothetical protein [Cellulomonas sp. S1-8]|uniref:hypothetical protein n=1 Tax=Cellulomonas sp. S1-8 TaxID=2904790 RepID=UPI0022448100|nr:hypothetical protein [Cellulomonas sp. S1-8]UZN02601.1 hypothetical protein OKX07_16320 [Cellulomonas sp. S1-8]
MSARRTAVLSATTATVLTTLALVGAATGASAGSDAPTPYRVTGTGIELPAGATFEVHGHVNVVATSALGTMSRNVHIEGPGSRFGDLAGASTLTWDRIDLPPDACITWVQVAGYDEHFGEGGQEPVCRTGTTPPAAAPEPSAAPSAGVTPSAVPSASVVPPASATPSAAPPVVPAPTPSADVAAAPTPAPTATVGAAPTATAVAAPAPTPTERSEVLAAGDATPTPSPATQVPAATAERSDVLAATGARTGALLGGAALALALGTTLVVWRRRTARP